MRDPPGAHATQGDEYLAALRSGKEWGLLIQLVGRYGFDPAPVLIAELAAWTYREDDPVFTLLNAACLAGPAWDASLVPFVHDLMIPMAEDPLMQSYPGFTGRIFVRDVAPVGTAALRRMGPMDLVEDLLARADWDAVHAHAQQQRTNAITLRRVQQDYFGPLVGAPHC